ncbi:MAG TPA: glycosyltransferase family 2 protein [Patescibacteria group bacterium]|nr:glycosyltransferase family 2 protein [Patescibacteria group bacterium]
MVDLSIIIVSYNTKDLAKKCLDTLIDTLSLTPKVTAEIIVVDNASSDNSVYMLKKYAGLHKNVKTIFNSQNSGFAKANNEGFAAAQGMYILCLNSDVLANNTNFEDLLYYMNKNKNVGALSVRVELPNGKIDTASHRGLPTIWRAFTYFSQLEKTFGKIPFFSKIFGGYHLLHLDINTIHEVEAISGAFFLTRKSIIDRTGGFDTRFFMYGEDLDLSYQIKKMGYKIIYYPLFTVLHLKYQSGLKKQLTAKSTAKKTRSKTKTYFFDSMRIFYDKHFAPKNNELINNLIYFFITLKRKLTK